MSESKLRNEILELLPAEPIESVIAALQLWGHGVSHARSCAVYRAVVALSEGSITELHSLVALLRSNRDVESLLIRWNELRKSIIETGPSYLTWFTSYVPGVACVALRFDLTGEASHGSIVLRERDLSEVIFLVPLVQEKAVYLSTDRTVLLAPKSTEGLRGHGGIAVHRDGLRDTLTLLLEKLKGSSSGSFER